MSVIYGKDIFKSEKKLRNSNYGEKKAILSLLQNVPILLSFLSIKIIVVVLCVKLSSEDAKYVHMVILTSLFCMSSLKLLLKVPFSANQAASSKRK